MTALVAFLLLIFCGAADAQVVSPFLQSKSINQTGAIPNGAPPQIIGYSATNTPESETVVGDLTFARTGVNQYTATVGSLNGVAFGPLATLSAGTGLTANVSTLSLTVPVAVSLGGTGTTTAPTTSGQLMLSQSAIAYAPITMSGDATINSGGVITVSKISGTTIGGTCSAGQFFSGLSAAGVPTCTTPAIAGIPNGAPPQFIGWSASGAANAEAETLGGGSGACTFSRTGAGSYALNCNYVAAANPTFTGTVTLPDGSTWTSSGLTSTGTATFATLNSTNVNATNIAVNNSSGSYTAVNGATYKQPGYNPPTYPAYWDINGLQNFEAIAIGQTTSDPFDIFKQQNSLSQALNTNSGAGANTQASWTLSDGANKAYFLISGSSYSGGSPDFIRDYATISADQGIILAAHTGLPIQMDVNNSVVSYFSTNGLHLTLPLEVTSGGTATNQAPTQNQILVAQNTSKYQPVTMSGDVSITSTGATTVNNIQGQSTGSVTGWTPALAYQSGGGPTVAYITGGQKGVYTRVGNIVFWTFYLAWSSFSAGAGGNVVVSGLPFTLNSNTPSNAAAAGWAGINLTNGSINNSVLGCFMNGNQFLLEASDPKGAGFSQMSNANFLSGSGSLYCQGWGSL